MRKFLLKIVYIFIIPIVLLMYPADYVISYYLSESRSYAGGEIGVWKDVYSGNINADLFMVHPEHGFRLVQK